MSAIIQNAQNQCKEGNYYSGLQMLKGLLNRYSKQKKYVKSIVVIRKSFSIFKEYERLELCVDLGKSLLDVFDAMGSSITIEGKDIEMKKGEKVSAMDLILEFVNAFEKDTEEKVKYLTNSLKWVRKSKEKVKNHELEKLLAKIYWNLKAYKQSHEFYLQIDDAESHSKMVFDWSKGGKKNEKDLFIVRVVLDCLSAKKFKYGNEIFEKYLSLCKEDEKENSGAYEDGFNTSHIPLLNYVKLLFKALGKRNRALFIFLNDKYERELERDESFESKLVAIDKAVFNTKTEKDQLSSMLENMMGGMFGNK